MFRWHKSSFSGLNECVELGANWRKSSYSGADGDCVELGDLGALRDSKNPDGPVITVRVDRMVAAVKAGLLDR